MINKILEMAAGVAQHAEVYELVSEEVPIHFENNRLKYASSRSTSGYALRIIKDGKIGFSSTTRQDGTSDLVNHAVETAEFGQEARFGFPSQPSSIPSVKVMDPDVANLKVEQLVAVGQDVLDGIRQAEPEAQVSVGVEKAVSRRRIVNTNGLDLSSDSTYYSVGGGLELVRGTDMLQVWDGSDSRSKIDHAKVVSEIVEKAKAGRNITTIETRTMPVIFTPKGFFMTLGTPFLMAFSGKEVLQGATPVSDKMGQQALDPRISIYDDGTIDFLAGSCPFDDEGVPVSRLPLVENGVIKNFIYDLDTAARAGVKPTGNGQRGLGSLPSPSYNLTAFTAGQSTLADMIGSIKYGLLVDQTIGAWAGNVRSGDFSGNVHLGIKIENGKMVGRVKDVMISGNVFEALRNVEATEDKCHMKFGIYAPHILFAGLSVASRG